MNILHCLLHYVDFNLSANAQQVNSDLLRVIAKYIDVFHRFFAQLHVDSMFRTVLGPSLERSTEDIETRRHEIFFFSGSSFELERTGQWMGLRVDSIVVFRLGTVCQERAAW